MKKNMLDAIIYNASIAAIYVVVTLITYPISYRGIQFRFAEILMIFAFFRKEYGFDGRETWNLDKIFIEWIYTRVKYYKEHTCADMDFYKIK